MLTVEQVHENNIVAKRWISELTTEIKKLKDAKEERKALPFMTRLAYELSNSSELHTELYVLHQLEFAMLSLKLYFKYHYKDAALTSKMRSPELTFSTTSDYIIFSINKTYKLGSVPHEVKYV